MLMDDISMRRSITIAICFLLCFVMRCKHNGDYEMKGIASLIRQGEKAVRDGLKGGSPEVVKEYFIRTGEMLIGGEEGLPENMEILSSLKHRVRIFPETNSLLVGELFVISFHTAKDLFPDGYYTYFLKLSTREGLPTADNGALARWTTKIGDSIYEMHPETFSPFYDNLFLTRKALSLNIGRIGGFARNYGGNSSLQEKSSDIPLVISNDTVRLFAQASPDTLWGVDIVFDYTLMQKHGSGKRITASLITVDHLGKVVSAIRSKTYKTQAYQKYHLFHEPDLRCTSDFRVFAKLGSRVYETECSH